MVNLDRLLIEADKIPAASLSKAAAPNLIFGQGIIPIFVIFTCK